MKPKQILLSDSAKMSNVEMLIDIRNSAHHVAKQCEAAFDEVKSLPSARVMATTFNTAIRAMREAKRYNLLP